MSLLGKFKDFEIKSESRLSEDDQKWLDAQYSIALRKMEMYKKVYDLLQCEENHYTEFETEVLANKYQSCSNSCSLISFDITRLTSEVYNGFIKCIYNHFSYKYNVSLDNKFTKRDIYNREPSFDLISKDEVMESIFNQLGGCSFVEKSKNELRSRLSKLAYNNYQNKWEVSVKGNKFTYKGGWTSQDYFGRYSFKRVDWLKDALDAISYDQCNEAKNIDGFEELYRGYGINLTEDMSGSGICSADNSVRVKFFKNGRVDITFKDSETTRKYAENWYGYRE